MVVGGRNDDYGAARRRWNRGRLLGDLQSSSRSSTQAEEFVPVRSAMPSLQQFPLQETRQ